MNDYWTEGEDLDLFSDSEGIGDYYGEAVGDYYGEAVGDYYGEAVGDYYGEAVGDYYGEGIYGDDTEATVRDHRAQTVRVQAARARAARARAARARAARARAARARGWRRPHTFRPRPPRPSDFPQTAQNIDDYAVGDIDDYAVGDIDDYAVGDIDDEAGGDDDYAEFAEGLREALHEDYEEASPEALHEALSNILQTMTLAEGFNFEKALRQIASTALPKAGAIVGTAVGAPVVGTAIGGQLGQVAGQALSGKGKPSSAPAPAKTTAASPKGGSAAAAKVVELTQNQDILKSLLALALGEHGKKSIPIGKNGQSVSVAAVVDLLNTFIGQAAKDAEELLGETQEPPAYLLDSEGNFRVDPVVPEDRAQALYQALVDAENQRLAEEAALYSAYLEFDDESDADDYDEEALDDLVY